MSSASERLSRTARAAPRSRGPSALGGGRRRFFDLLWLTAVTEFKLGYHGTVLGFVWSILRPLLLFAVLLFVFTQVFRFGDDVKNYPAMLLFNIMLFTLLRRRDDRRRDLGRRAARTSSARCSSRAS